MAIIGLFECQVLVNGEPLHEYDDDNDERDHSKSRTEEDASSKFSAQYVQAVASANFAIKCHVKPGFHFEEADYLAVRFILDGQFHAEADVRKTKYSKSKDQACSKTKFDTRSGDDTEGFISQKFLFGEIVTGEVLACHNLEDQKLKYGELSSIKVEIWRKKTSSTTRGAKGKQSQTLEAIPEEVLKGRAISHRSGRDCLGEAERITSSSRRYKGKRLDNGPIATFVFKYRSTEALKQLFVIPRTLSSTLLEERPIEELSVEELRERLRRREEDVEATRARVKKEKAEGNPHTTQAVKRFRDDVGIDEDNEVETIGERSAHKKQRPAAEQEVIDLAD